MDLTIERESLLGALKLARVAAGSGKLPLVKIAAFMGEAEIVASDLTVSVRQRHRAEVRESGAVAVAARDAYDVVKNLADSPVTLTIDGSHAKIVAGSSRFRLVTYSTEGVVAVETPPDEAYAAISAPMLSGLLRRGGSAHGSNQARSHLTNMKVESNGETLTVVSTDGHRLHKADAACTWQPGDVDTIPPTGRLLFCDVLSDVEGDCEIATVKGVWFVRIGQAIVSARETGQPFPAWQRVIPATVDRAVTVELSHLTEVVRRVSLMADRPNHCVKLELRSGELAISATRDEFGEADETIEVDYDPDGDDFTTALSSVYFLAALEHVPGDHVRLEFNGELDPTCVRPFDPSTGEIGEDYVAVIMPLRL